MAEIRPPYRHDLDTLVRKTYLNGIFATGDALANCFAVELYKGSVSYTIPSGATVKGYFVRNGKDTIELPGTKSGNVVSVTLNSACYNQNGPFTLTIKVLEGSAVTTVFYGEGSMAVSRTGITVNPSFEAVEYYKHPVNLLDNSNFASPIAQAGYNGKHGAAYYLTDRWLISGINIADGRTLTATKLSQSMRLVSTYQYLYISQNVTNVSGKTLTFAVKALRRQQIAMRIYDESGNLLAGSPFSGEGTFVNAITVNVPSNVNTIVCYIYPGFVDGGGTTEIYWAALYEGEYTAETLPPYRPKPYSVELAECQMYHVELGRQSAYGWAYHGGWATVFVPLPAQMRIAHPSVTFKSALNSIYINGIGYSATYVACDTRGNGVLLSFSYSGDVMGMCVIPDLDIAISADL